MKKSTAIKLTLLASAALAVSGCTRNQARRCVDQDQRIVGDEFCDPNGAVRRTGTGGVHYWLYGGSGSRIGEHVVGGSVSPSGVSRGGFGSSMSGRVGS
jgi:hypothetical protein